MSYSLKLSDGDLSATGSHLDIVQGIDKLTQDIDLWLREDYQIDRFHTSFGSILDSFIGGVIDNTTQITVQAEILRVMQNYQNLQLLRFKAKPEKFSPDELLHEVTGINVQVAYDKIVANLYFTTVSGATGATTLAVSL